MQAGGAALTHALTVGSVFLGCGPATMSLTPFMRGSVGSVATPMHVLPCLSFWRVWQAPSTGGYVIHALVHGYIGILHSMRMDEIPTCCVHS